MELAKRVGFVVMVGLVASACGDDAVSGALVQRGSAGTLALDGGVGADVVQDATVSIDVASETTTAEDAAGDSVHDIPDDVTADADDVLIEVDDAALETSVETDAASVACTKPEDCPTPPACWRATCVQETCGLAPDNQASCDDGDACTLADHCAGGACHGTPKVCDDGDACTSDACAQAQCTFTPIVGCVTDTQCVGKEAGTACNDGVATTSADLCLEGVCRGFETIRIAASGVPDAADIMLTEIDHGPDGWSVILAGTDVDGAEGHALARLTTPASPFVYAATLQDMPFHGLHDGFVTDEDGYVWQFLGGAWTFDNPWDDAVWLTGRAYGRGLWTMRDTRDASDTRRLWIVGDDGIDEWIRYCHDEGGEAECFEQDLDDFDPSSLPVAVTGVPACDPGGCARARMALAADASADNGAFNDTFENADGQDGHWDKGAVPGSSTSRRSRAIAGWGEAAQAQFLVVGTGGHIVHRRAGGAWSAPLTLKDGQSTRTFSGVVAAGGLVAIVAHRSAGGGQRAYELWTAPMRKDVEVAANWTIHTLLTAPAADGAAPYDVDVAAGEVRIVGAVARVESGQVRGLDGLALVRAP